MGHHHQVSGRNLGIAVVLNILITLAQIIGGVISGSLAILSDALHNFSDVLSLILAYGAHLLSKRKQSFTKTYGFKRAEVLAAFVNASTLILIAIYLIAESFKRFFQPEKIDSNLVIWLATFSVLANGASVLLMTRDAKNNLNMRAAYWHLLSDMLTSIAVLAGGLVMKYTGKYGIDALLSIIIGIYLIFLGIKLLKESYEILMQFAPKDINVEKLCEEISKIQGVRNIHHVHIWRLNEKEVHMEAHILLENDISVSGFDKMRQEIEKILKDSFGISHINLQPEYNCNDSQLLINPHKH